MNRKSPILYLTLLCVALFLMNCKKEATSPSLQTLPVSEIARTSALFSATISYQGSDSLLEES